MITILDFISEPKKKTAVEYSSSCPSCGGDDRFTIWINEGKGGRFYCRQCGITGDGIQYLRDFNNMSYSEAVEALCVEDNFSPCKEKITSTPLYTSPNFPSAVWIEKATVFFDSCIKNLNVPELLERHLTPQICIECGVGYNVSDVYIDRKDWGLEDVQVANGIIRNKIRIPKGIVIATKRKNKIVGLTIRRSDYKAGDKTKYWQVASSANIPFLLGKSKTPLVVLESALDAVLLYQETNRAFGGVALMGCSKIPDKSTFDFTNQAPLLIATPDNDTAGKKAWYNKWRECFPQATLLYPYQAKDLGEMHTLSLQGEKVPSLREWAEICLNHIDNIEKEKVKTIEIQPINEENNDNKEKSTCITKTFVRQEILDNIHELAGCTCANTFWEKLKVSDLIPCPKNKWWWIDKKVCYDKCKSRHKDCILEYFEHFKNSGDSCK